MIFSTGKDAVIGVTPYVLVNVTGLFAVDDAVAVSDPSPLSTTLTVTVLPVVASGSFVTPETVPVSVTVYVYVPGAEYVNGPKVTVSVVPASVLLTVPVIIAASGAPLFAVTVIV